jgi:Asp-tRNA(Asn)/Glu-tRNA(Gln) amidotransferase A subunit family amidase
LSAAATASAVDIARRVRARQLSPLDAVERALAAIAAHNPTLNACNLVLAAEARESAARLAERIERGDDPGPLAGVPVTIKDVVWMRGVPASAGSRALADTVPRESAAVVDRLEAAGAIVVGRTNIPEFCYRGTTRNALYGATGNPFDETRSAGGSSGGAGAAAATGMSPLALGGDGGGSIRIPASFCGVVGHKPTFGLVPKAPEYPGWQTLTVVGPLAFTVEDCGLALQAMAGPDPRDPLTLPALGLDYAAAAAAGGPLTGLRVAWSEDLGYVRLDDEVRERFREAVARFARLGGELEQAHPPTSTPVDAWNTIACADNWVSEGPLLASGLVADDARELIEAGRDVSAATYVAARNARFDYSAEWDRFFARYDLLLTPTLEVAAFPNDRWSPPEIAGKAIGEFYDDWCHFCYPANLTGQPATSVPMAPAASGLPLGLQIVARRYRDDVALRAAAAWQAAAGWERPPPRTAAVSPVPDWIARADADHERRARCEGLDADGSPVRAGELLSGARGTLRVRRAWSPRPDVLEVDWEPAESVPRT